MRPLHFALCALLSMLAGGCGRDLTGAAGGNVPPLEVAQGAHVNVGQFAPFPVAEWHNLSGPDAGYVSRNGSYHAPLTLAAERPITLEARAAGWTSQVHVLLQPGPVERSDCLAPGQPEIRDDPGAFVHIEELPEAVVRVPPGYPDLAREAGVEGTVLVEAFVCACGEVSDVRIVKSIPMLDQASKDAVRQWLFVPALTDGEPVATWVVIPVKFSLH